MWACSTDIQDYLQGKCAMPIVDSCFLVAYGVWEACK